jgi:Bacteriophage tail sheath protein
VKCGHLNPEWKYINLRRYFIYLEHSIDRATQWAVFEATEAYFVKCDRTTMTQRDLDNGRFVCLVGVAPLRPAEFVIFRLGANERPRFQGLSR